GDNGRYKPRIVGEDNDFIDGGPNDDYIYVGDGKDYLTGGADKDTFVFQFYDPIPGWDGSAPWEQKPWLGSGPDVPMFSVDITTIEDFDPKEDTFAFDAVGLLKDGFGANFINQSSLESGNAVSSFFSGAASAAHGEHAVVITDEAFTSAADAAKAISGETVGDIIVYCSDDGITSLAYVTAENQARDFTHLGGVDSLADLANLGLTASDFTFV
ncbi:hemolysin expression modulating protein, partial [Mesorhizobium loti]